MKISSSSNQGALRASVSGHFPKKCRHFVFPKRFCALELGLGLRLELTEMLLKEH